ncbi:MAG: hypothetical protein IKJ82_07045 [Oscillospiraceae bacterium]|nr:hypothetical protein [Oscillospiraceae bacterium]
MYKNVKCQSCGVSLEFVKQEHLQLGKDSYFGKLEHWASGALFCDIYVCPECGEIHFFKADDDTKNPEAELRKCGFCMKKYDKNYPHCPHCGRKPGEC